jgi:hypothetical protein
MSSTRRRDFTAYSDTVLYDVFFEAGTMLGGSLVEAERQARAGGDEEVADAHRQVRYAMVRARRRVGATDRDAQVAAIEEWGRQRAVLERGQALPAAG